MPHLLKNKDLEVQIDLPDENYRLSRFDWTGKIVSVKFKGKYVSGVEKADALNENLYGKGFYNEFGMDAALGFEEAEIGGEFHKIGLGYLQKDSHQYDFQQKYKLSPAEFLIEKGSNLIRIQCLSKEINGYAYHLEKEIKITYDGFNIHSQLKNTGQKAIQTTEYNHNFLALDRNLIDKDYRLSFPFQLNPDYFGENVNPEKAVDIGIDDFTFNATPKQQFFFSELSGGKLVNAHWKLENFKSKIGISETGDFPPSKVNLWGWEHVISPELFFNIDLEVGQSIKWVRAYRVFEIGE
ncbi:MAG: hypothetical protein MRZ79_13365 [Bacteroidia bacterium]|nr:hypothetical protein [Bacteroidia bacterium]